MQTAGNRKYDFNICTMSVQQYRCKGARWVCTVGFHGFSPVEVRVRDPSHEFGAMAGGHVYVPMYIQEVKGDPVHLLCPFWTLLVRCPVPSWISPRDCHKFTVVQ